MKTTEKTKTPDKSDILLFIVLGFFIVVLVGGIATALFTMAINTLLVLFAIDMVPFSLYQGLMIWASLMIIRISILGIRRPSKDGI